jgi:hypothetical protein
MEIQKFKTTPREQNRTVLANETANRAGLVLSLALWRF